MNLTQLQKRLIDRGQDLGPAGADGVYGTFTRNAVLAAMTNLHANAISDTDIEGAARDLGTSTKVIRAVLKVESAGKGFSPEGRPMILYEPHVFSRQTNHRFDVSHPSISSRKWNRSLYKGTQQGRYEQLLYAISLDVDAAFMACSYGLFQILGENWAVCTYESPWAMAVTQAQSEGDQLEAFVRFVRGNHLESKLRACTSNAEQCVGFVKAYNGPAYATNRYHFKIAQEIARAA